MKVYRYLFSYHFIRKEFSSELNRKIDTNGFGDATGTIKGELTSEKINRVREQIKEANDFSGVVILNVIRLEEVE